MRNAFKKQKGITLIALIITIIVLLILAGVTISSISGNENVMGKANEAKEKQDVETEKEDIQMIAISILAKTKSLTITDETKLETELQGKVTSITKHNNHWDVIGNTGTEYILTSDGDVLKQDDLDSFIDIRFDTIERYDNQGRINFLLLKNNNNDDINIIKWACLTYRGSKSYEDGLTLEIVDSDIVNSEFSLEYAVSSFRIKDIGNGVIVRPYVKYTYDGHEFTKYEEQVHVYYANLPTLP